jgi:hypothetical protein
MNLRTALALAALISSTSALADPYYYGEAPGVTPPPPGTTTSRATDVTSGYLSNQTTAFTPQLGVLTYGTPFDGTQVRGVIGLGFDMNALRLLSPPENRGNLYIGPQTGIFFAHTGSASAGFVGTGATTTDAFANAGYTWIPLDLKVGYSFSDNFRLSVHGGGNIVYQSISGTVIANNGATATTATSSSWNIYPNFGGDVELGVGHNVSILIRPDVTFASNTNPFSGTVGLGLALS